MTGTENVVSRIQYNHTYQFFLDFFENQPDYIDVEQQKNLGEDIRANSNLYWVRSGTVGLDVARDKLSYMMESTQIAKFALPISSFNRDLMDLIRLSHWQGISSTGGYNDVPARVVSIDVDLQPLDSKVYVRSVLLPFPEVATIFYVLMEPCDPNGQPWGALGSLPFGETTWDKLVDDPLYWALVGDVEDELY